MMAPQEFPEEQIASSRAPSTSEIAQSVWLLKYAKVQLQNSSCNYYKNI